MIRSILIFLLFFPNLALPCAQDKFELTSSLTPHKEKTEKYFLTFSLRNKSNKPFWILNNNMQAGGFTMEFFDKGINLPMLRKFSMSNHLIGKKMVEGNKPITLKIDLFSIFPELKEVLKNKKLDVKWVTAITIYHEDDDLINSGEVKIISDTITLSKIEMNP